MTTHGSLSPEERALVDDAIAGLLAMTPKSVARAAGYLTTAASLAGMRDAEFAQIAAWVGRILEVIGHRANGGRR